MGAWDRSLVHHLHICWSTVNGKSIRTIAPFCFGSDGSFLCRLLHLSIQVSFSPLIVVRLQPQGTSCDGVRDAFLRHMRVAKYSERLAEHNRAEQNGKTRWRDLCTPCCGTAALCCCGAAPSACRVRFPVDHSSQEAMLQRWRIGHTASLSSLPEPFSSAAWRSARLRLRTPACKLRFTDLSMVISCMPRVDYLLPSGLQRPSGEQVVVQPGTNRALLQQ